MKIQKFAQKGIVVNENQKILLVHYSEQKHKLPITMAGHWGFPGGKVDFGETPELSIVREIKEETGITCKPKQPIYVWNWHYTINEDEIQINAIIRVCEYLKGSTIANRKDKEMTIDQIEWIRKDKTLKLPFVEDELPGLKLWLES